MREVMTTTMARKYFLGGSIFFFIFLGLTAHSHLYIVNTSTASMPLTEFGSARQAGLGGQRVHQLPQHSR